MIIDLGRQEIYIRKSKDRFSKKKGTKYWTLPIQKRIQDQEENKYNLKHMIRDERCPHEKYGSS